MKLPDPERTAYSTADNRTGWARGQVLAKIEVIQAADDRNKRTRRRRSKQACATSSSKGKGESILLVVGRMTRVC